ncbi:hypothetical protein [Pelagicoccus sp. SDUM812005]|uniref:hypothetical protein n=1 Tax=Pelagicoccus sp. SDUM812005 TaxID=3041257 RepID=UPI00280D2E47|nr:hypothetical protein [Pelagicoccus sp. SDUM812005]MDQ8181348.1 hypothetical protein [Pelagicoccus sp. SDUM812005]
MKAGDEFVVLITGGRSPVALEMCRIFGREGARVIVAESSGGFLCQASRFVAAFHKVPSPRFQTEAYVSALLEIMREEGVDLLVPTCEEVFYISRFRERLTEAGRVFAPDFACIEALHRKDCFVEWAAEIGLPVPWTALCGEAVLGGLSKVDRFVLKPVYSRFGCETILRQGSDIALANDGRAWVVQEFLEGEELHSYAIAQDGRILQSVFYRGLAKEGAMGPSLAFEEVDCPAGDAWVRRFVEEIGFTGQIAFDFILGVDGVARAIECNPRATSGLHLLSEGSGVYDAIVVGISGETRKRKLPNKGLLLPSLLSGAKGDFEDVVFRWDDPLPAMAQFLTLAYFGGLALRSRRSLAAEMVHDFCWNGGAIE